MASGLSETAKLVSSLELKDNFTPTANKAIKSLGKLESTGFRVGQQIGKGFNNAAHNLKRIAQVGVIALTGAIALGVKSLGDLARTQNQTAAVIASTGGKAKVSAKDVRAYAESLEDLSTVDDKVIQDGENLLLTFTKISKDTFPQATKAALDMALALANGNVENVDLKASALAVGKALNDPVKGMTALRKSGVTFSEKQQKVIKALVKSGDLLGAQKVILAELNKEFGKSSTASGQGPEAVMRRLSDAGEDLSQILARGTLPVLERFGKFLTAKLTDPAFMAQVDEFGTQLGIAGGKFLDFVEKVDFKAIGNALKIGADAAGAIIGAFLKAPTWLQTAIVTGWGLNKLTGGAVTGIFGELASGLIKGVLGINAGTVNVRGAVVTGGPGGTSTGGGGSKGGKLLSAAAKVFIVGAAVGAFAELVGIRNEQSAANRAQAGALTTQTNEFVKVAGIDAMQQSLSGILAYDRDLSTSTDILNGNVVAFQLNIDGVRDAVRAQEATLLTAINATVDPQITAVEDMKGKMAADLTGLSNDTKAAGIGAALASAAAAVTTASATTAAGYGIQQAVRSSQPIVTTNTDVRVYVTAAGVTKSVTEQSRYGKGNGSAGGGGDSGVSSSDL